MHLTVPANTRKQLQALAKTLQIPPSAANGSINLGAVVSRVANGELLLPLFNKLTQLESENAALKTQLAGM